MGSPFGCDNDTDGSNITITAVTTTETMTPTTLKSLFIMAPPPLKNISSLKKFTRSYGTDLHLQALNIL
jgi:hypothetical protein